MATQDSIMGLFASPEQIQQAQYNQALDRNIQLAKLSPVERGLAQLGTSSYILGGAIGSALGAEDPMLKLAALRQRAMQGLDQTSPEHLAAAAGALNQAGDYQGARALAMAAQEAALKQSQVTRNLRERPVGMSELGKLQAERADLVKEFGENDPRVKQYDDKIAKLTTGKSMGQEIGEAVATSFGMLGKALGPALVKEGEGTGEFAAKDFNALGSAVAAGTASKRNLATLETALQNSFTGKFADSKESIITSLTALGVPVGDDLKQAATNKQLVDAMGTRYVFPLVKNFPGSLAAKELDRLEKTAPNSLQQPETIQRLVNLMKVDLAENEYTYNQAKQYKANKQGSLIGYNQADSKIEFQQKLSKLQGMIGSARKKGSMTQEEKAAIEALKQELGV